MASVIKELIREDAEYLLNMFQQQEEKFKTLIDERLYNFDQYVKTGDRTFLLKECGITEDVQKQQAKRVGRPRKGVLEDITTGLENVKIKQEKVSIFSSGSSVDSISTVTNSVDEIMPPPKEPPRKRAIKVEPVDVPKRSTRTRKKPERFEDFVREESTERSSDVIIQNTTITKITLIDDSDSTSSVNENNPDMAMRPKRTRTIRKVNGQPLEHDDVENNQKETADQNVIMTLVADSNNENRPDMDARPKRTRTIRKEKPEQVENKNEDEQSFSQEPLNQHSVKNVQPTLNCTVVIEKSKLIENKPVEVAPATPPRQNKNKKEIFSPFEKVSTMDKVKAFEKLTNSESVASPTVKTGTVKKSGNVSRKPNTPMNSKYIPKVQSTTKVNRVIHGQESSNNNLISTKSASALKASQAEYRERERLRLEKEKKAAEKREALLLTLMEEKKRKREEKQMRVQQQREMLEKEKQKTLEGKYKNTDNHAKKRKIDEGQSDGRMRGTKLPLYMITRPPLLPTPDCYDSDDEEYKEHGSYKAPSWTRSQELKKMQLVMASVGETCKNTFFSRQLHTADLQELFEIIDPRKLKRTSSAIWRKPPRYTLLMESSGIQFSEDDDF